MTMTKYSRMGQNLKRSEIRELLKLTRQPDMISFAGGLPAPELFPYDDVKQASIEAIDLHGQQALQYSPTEGDPYLKQQIVKFMARQGEIITDDNLLIVSSSQQGLDLMAKIFIDPYDTVIVEKPTYVGGLQAFRSYNAQFHGIPMDKDGIIPELLEEEIKYLNKIRKPPKFIYLIPDFQNPSGVTLSLERRMRVLEIASRHNLLIFEDSPYRELRFEGENYPSLYSLDNENRVLYMKTLSKIYCPGFRLGWIMGPIDIIEKLVITKQSADLCTSAFVSIVTAVAMENGLIETQVEKSRKLYAEKAKLMLEMLEEYMPAEDGLSWSEPEGGVFLWLELPENIDTTEMFMQAVEKKVAYVVGAAFYPDSSGNNTLRLNFSYPSKEQIVKGIKSLAEVVTECLKRSCCPA